MKRRQFLAATGVASITTLAGCGGSGGGTPTPAESSIAATVTITEDETYDPTVIEVDEGESVEWANNSGKERQLRANTQLEDSVEWELDLDIPAEGSSAHTFDESGVYSYHDAEETWFNMCGAVAVGDFTADDVPDLQCESGNV